MNNQTLIFGESPTRSKTSRGFFTTTGAAFVWIKFPVLWKVALDRRIILRWIFTKWDVGVIDWIEPAQDRHL
jgi:hypothetical protein